MVGAMGSGEMIGPGKLGPGIVIGPEAGGVLIGNSPLSGALNVQAMSPERLRGRPGYRRPRTTANHPHPHRPDWSFAPLKSGTSEAVPGGAGRTPGEAHGGTPGAGVVEAHGAGAGADGSDEAKIDPFLDGCVGCSGYVDIVNISKKIPQVSGEPTTDYLAMGPQAAIGGFRAGSATCFD